LNKEMSREEGIRLVGNSVNHIDYNGANGFDVNPEPNQLR